MAICFADQKRMLELAREAILERLTRGSTPSFRVTEPALCAPGGVFVTLLLDGALRGCIGTLDDERPRHETLVEMAVAAAIADDRFAALTTRELREVDIEVSLIGPFAPIEPSAVEVGRHGLYLVAGSRRGVVLPQVARQLRWDRAELLARTGLEAGLGREGWRDGSARLFAFEAFVFSDTSLAQSGWGG